MSAHFPGKAWVIAYKLSQHVRLWLFHKCNHRTVSNSSLSRLIDIAHKMNNKDGHMKETALKDRMTGQSNYVVSIEGNIGSGKTEMLKYFHNKHDCEILQEPVEKWRNIHGHNVLDLMYQNPERWGMALQSYIQLTMLQTHTQPQEKPARLIERSIFSAKYCFVENLFRSGKMQEIEYLILTEWFEWIIKTQKIQVDLIVYLQTDPEILHSRIMNRCREEEQDIQHNYLKNLHQLHEDWLIHKKFPCPAEVLIIDANSALEKMPESYEQHRSRIVQSASC